MDDTSMPCCATDCALIDLVTGDDHDGSSRAVSLSAEFDPLPPPQESDTTLATDRGPSVDDRPAAGPRVREADALEAARVIEALLFSSDVPLTAVRLAELVGSCTPGLVRKHIAALNEKYEGAGLSFRIEPIARGYQMMTLPDFSSWVAKLHKQHSETRLSAAALETLSIIAYKQPVIRADVEAIRGVASGDVIGRLRDIGLVRVVGRAEVVGRPLLYGTTRRFLDVFGLVDLDDLPPMEALRLKAASKPVEEVEPVKPPPVPQPAREPCAVAGT
jgi:segregation and condensation protein B